MIQVEKPQKRKRVIGWHLSPRDTVRAIGYEIRSSLRLRRGRRVFVVGHMVDMPDAKSARLPDTNNAINKGRQSVWLALSRLDKQKTITDLVVCSGAAGTDAWALQWMDRQKIEDKNRSRLFRPFRTAKMYLPFSRKSFVEHSVSYGEHAYVWADAFNKAAHFGIVHKPHLRNPLTWPFGGWNPTYDRAMQYSKKVNNGFGRQFYIDVNIKMLSKIRRHRNDAVIVLWDGKDATLDPQTGRPKPGGTYDVLDRAIAKGIKRENIVIIQGGLVNPRIPSLDSLYERHRRNGRQ